MTTAGDPVRVIAALFTGEHGGRQPGQVTHMLQSAALAHAGGAPPGLVAAALLHDVGRFAPVAGGCGQAGRRADRHSTAGAAWLAQWFGPEVTEPVRLHVAAKRYLCAVEPGYAASLPPAPAVALGRQGGLMTRVEMAEFEASPHACAALRLRRWDDCSAEAGAAPPAFAYYQPLLRRLLMPRVPSPPAS